MKKLHFALILCIALTFCADRVSCATGSLISSFTVNGGASATVAAGQSITFESHKLDSVANPSWTLMNRATGRYIFGGPGGFISSRSLIFSTAASCDMNGIIECQATSGGVTDIQTVTVTISPPCAVVG